MLDLTKFPVQYNFDTIYLDLINSNGKLKEKYKCLAYMITLPLILSPLPEDSLVQVKPLYNEVILTSTSNQNGYLIFSIPPINDQTSIITSQYNILNINYYAYYYDVKVTVIKKGDLDVDLRFMTFNINNDSLASNLNDIYSNETSYQVTSGKTFTFTITGKYTNFFAYYPNTNFEIELDISVSNKKIPIFICKKKCAKCTCYEIDNVGYLRVKNNNVPVYIKSNNGAINTYLYPTFAMLRDIFISTTFNNSLQAPIPITSLNKFIIKVNEPVVISYLSNGFEDANRHFIGSNGGFPTTGEEWSGVLYSNTTVPANSIISLISSNSGSPWIVIRRPDLIGGYLLFEWEQTAFMTFGSGGNYSTFLAPYDYNLPGWGLVTDLDGKNKIYLERSVDEIGNVIHTLHKNSYRINGGNIYFYLGKTGNALVPIDAFNIKISYVSK